MRAGIGGQGFGDPPPAGGAGRGGAAFVDQAHGDAGQFGLVLQWTRRARPATAAAAGCAAARRRPVSRRVADHQGRRPGAAPPSRSRRRPRAGPGGPAAGAGPRPGAARRGTSATAATRADPAWAPGRRPAAGFGRQVQVFGADRPPRHQQPVAVGGDGVGWMIPRSTPATRPGSGRPARPTGTSAVTSRNRRPPSYSRVTERTCSAGYGTSRSRRTHSGDSLAVGSRSRRPSRVNVP